MTTGNTSFTAYNGYEDQDYDLSITNGAERVSFSLRALNQIKGLGASVDTTTAREIAADIIARADIIDSRRAQNHDR